MSKYVILDLEMCAVPKGEHHDTYPWKNEIIQIGAVLLDDSLEISDKFLTYVAPQYGVLDKFIENLTRITPKDLEGAPAFAEALKSFLDWIPEGASMVAWSETDETQMRREIEAKNVDDPRIGKAFARWIDCQQQFGQRIDSPKTYSLSEALNIAGIYFEDGAHDALVDAHNTALLYAKMLREPELHLSPYYSTEDHAEASAAEAAFNPFAAALAKLRAAETAGDKV